MYVIIVKLFRNNLNGGGTKVCCITSERSEIRDLQLVFSCASARTSHSAPRRVVPPSLQTHTQTNKCVLNYLHEVMLVDDDLTQICYM